MGLRLSTAELGRLQHAQDVLLSPLDYATPELWGAAACDAVRRLLDAHQASLFATGDGAELWFTTLDEATTRDFMAHYAGVDPVSTQVVAQGIQCACAWDVVNRDQFHQSEFFNDFAGPNGLHDAMGMRIPKGPQSHLWLTFQHHRPLPEPEVRRRVALMQLVLPAFRAGARVAASLPLGESQLARLLDHLPQALTVASLDGRVLHRNTTMQRLLEEAPDRAVADAVPGLLLALSALRGRERPEPRGLIREVEAGGRRYRLSGSLAERGALGPEPVLLVQLDVDGPRGLAPEELRRRFGLTPREIEVALLLAERRTNQEVAETLHISTHTAERHTERVLGKMGLRSRLQVPSRLAGD